jgi:hypothetical protein
MKAVGQLTYSAARLPPRRPGSQAAAAAILLSMAVVTAQAANIEVTGPSRDGVATITVEGTLLVGDGDKFQEKTSTIRDAIVVLRSDGGAAFEGIKIGEAIRRKGFSSLVVARCASACAVAWLGGTHRFMAAGARIGFHAAYDAQSGQQTGYANARVGAYLNRIGLTDDAVTYVTAAPANSMTWLSISDAIQHSIDVTLLDVPDSFYLTQALARLGNAEEPAPTLAPPPEPPAAPLPRVSIVPLTPPTIEPPQTPVPQSPAVHSGWIIQVGAFEAEDAARQQLSAAQAKAGSVLGRADPFTEPVVKGDKTLYRARFAGLQKNEAKAICRQLKHNDIDCIIIPSEARREDANPRNDECYAWGSSMASKQHILRFIDGRRGT